LRPYGAASERDNVTKPLCGKGDPFSAEFSNLVALLRGMGKYGSARYLRKWHLPMPLPLPQPSLPPPSTIAKLHTDPPQVQIKSNHPGRTPRREDGFNKCVNEQMEIVICLINVSCAQAEVGEQLWPSCGGVASHEIPNKPDPTLLTRALLSRTRPF
jgi:hypothetical protein